MKHLVYTSAPRGLLVRSPGFCTVAMTPGIPPLLRQSLEHLSGYRSEEGADVAQPNLTHMKVNSQGGARHVISRIAPCAPDYSGRNNTIAHHVVFEPAEATSLDPLRYLGQDVRFYKNWNDDPRELEDSDISSHTTEQTAPCTTWALATGDAGHAGDIWRLLHDEQRTVAVLLPVGTDRIALIRELLALVAPGLRKELTFSTAPGADSSPEVECRLRLRIDCRKSREELDKLRSAVKLDFAAPRRATNSTQAQCARQGIPFPNETRPTTSASGASADVIAILKPPPPASRTPTRTTMPITGHPRRSQDAVDSHESSPLKTFMLFAAVFALGIAMTLVTRALIPSSSQPTESTPVRKVETVHVPADSDRGQQNAVIEQQRQSIAALQIQTERLTADLQVARNSLAEQTRIAEGLNQPTAQITIPTAPPAVASTSGLVRLEKSNDVFEPRRTLSANKPLPESIELAGFHAGSTVKVSIFASTSSFELSSIDDGARMVIKHRNPSKSVSQHVVTIAMRGGESPTLQLNWNPTASATPMGINLLLAGEQGDCVAVSLSPPQSISCELLFNQSTGTWRGELDPKRTSVADAILRKTADSAPYVNSPRTITEHAYEIRIVSESSRAFLEVSPHRKVSFDRTDAASIDGIEKNIQSALSRLDELKKQLSQDAQPKRGDAINKIRDEITYAHAEIAAATESLKQAKSDVAAISALNDYFVRESTWVLSSENAGNELILRLKGGTK